MPKVRFAHIGMITGDMVRCKDMVKQIFGAEPVSPVVADPKQEAFLQMFKSGQTFLELISPMTEESNVQTALNRKGEGVAHLCFETDDLAKTLDIVHALGALVFSQPTPAVLFGGKRVAFVMLPNKMIIEFVENGWEEGMESLMTTETV